MFDKIARTTFLFILALTVVAWAFSAGKSSPVEPQNDQLAEPWSIYC